MTTKIQITFLFLLSMILLISSVQATITISPTMLFYVDGQWRHFDSTQTFNNVYRDANGVWWFDGKTFRETETGITVTRIQTYGWVAIGLLSLGPTILAAVFVFAMFRKRDEINIIDLGFAIGGILVVFITLYISILIINAFTGLFGG